MKKNIGTFSLIVAEIFPYYSEDFRDFDELHKLSIGTECSRAYFSSDECSTPNVDTATTND